MIALPIKLQSTFEYGDFFFFLNQQQLLYFAELASSFKSKRTLEIKMWRGRKCWLLQHHKLNNDFGRTNLLEEEGTRNWTICTAQSPSRLSGSIQSRIANNENKNMRKKGKTTQFKNSRYSCSQKPAGESDTQCAQRQPYTSYNRLLWLKGKSRVWTYSNPNICSPTFFF